MVMMLSLVVSLDNSLFESAQMPRCTSMKRYISLDVFIMCFLFQVLRSIFIDNYTLYQRLGNKRTGPKIDLTWKTVEKLDGQK